MAGGKASIREEMMVIPTYELGEEERLPIFYRLRINQGTRGDIYPYKNKDILTQKLNPDHRYKALVLENDYIRVTVLPELGGRIYEGYDKVNDYHFVYKNNVIKPALIGLNGAWISGGIEFNWPQHHRPTTFQPVEYTIEEETDGSATAWVGETESKNGQRSLMGIRIRPDSNCLSVCVRLYNPTAQKEAFHWWANLAVHVNDSYRLMFPPDIDYVTFHNKTHVSPFPVVKGEFAGTDYGEDGVDIRYIRNLQPAASFFIFDSAYSFMAGYDESRNMGTVHVADRYVSPGKKFFTWGKAGYGEAWQKNLTDEDGDYIEIMTGCFTDNQPDFTWVMPGETKSFEQCWYPLNGIRDLKNATKEAALGVYRDEKGLAVSFNVTSPCRASLWINECVYPADAVPGQVYTIHTQAGASEIRVRLLNETGRELVSWSERPMFFEGKKPPVPRERPAAPQNIPSSDELFINGLHTEQYKDAVIRPEIYYLEALKRDPGDVRCNTAMGILMGRKGKDREAKRYLTAAVERAASRNPNPADTESLYQLGLVCRRLGETEEALAAFKRAAWGYAWKGAALTQAAEIEIASGEHDAAERDLETALETNSRALRTMALRSALQVRSGRTEAVRETAKHTLQWDPLDVSSYMTLLLCGDQTGADAIRRILGEKQDAWLKLAEIYLSAGLYEEGQKVLMMCPSQTARVLFYIAWTADRLGEKELCLQSLKDAEDAPQERVFPCSQFDRTVLEFARRKTESARACYELGCLYYAWDNGEKAAECWQTAVRLAPAYADAHRGLAQCMFEIFEDTAAALTEMEKAFSCSREPRIFYEYYQLNKVLGASDEMLLSLLEDHMEITRKRQDLTLQYIEQLCRNRRLDKAREMLANTAFYTYEGGEGHVPALHAFTYIALGLNKLKAGDAKHALADFLEADSFPEHYHEGARFQESRSHIHYFKALGYQACGEKEKAEKEYREAAGQRDSAGVSQYYKGLALRAMGDYAGAAKLFSALKEQAQATLNCTSLQFFLGFPTALPFEQSERCTIEKAGYASLFFAEKGLGEDEQAKETAALMRRKGISSLWTEYLSGTDGRQ